MEYWMTWVDNFEKILDTALISCVRILKSRHVILYTTTTQQATLTSSL
jgi:hypothetical protein